MSIPQRVIFPITPVYLSMFLSTYLPVYLLSICRIYATLCSAYGLDGVRLLEFEGGGVRV